MTTTLTEMITALRPLLRHDPLVARSCKISGQGVSTDRFLLTFPRAAMVQAEPQVLGDLIRAQLPDSLTRHWQRAEVIHLGLDDADTMGGRVRKLYLEFSEEETPEQGLAYLALKAGPQVRLHRYDRLLDPAPVLADLALPRDLQDFVCRLAATCPILRVSEAGSARLSLDIGLMDCAPDPGLLDALGQIVARVNPSAAAPADWPSHVAIGRDRNGRPFVTLYGWPDAALQCA
jgi:hypothetical protein